MTNVKNIFSYRWLGACQSEIIPRNVSTQVSWLRNDINKDQIPRSVLRLFDNVYCLNQRTPVDNCWPKFATSRKFQQHWPPWAASSSLSTGQHVGAWVDSRSPFVYIRFLSFTGQSTQVDLNYGTYRSQNRQLKVVLARIMNAFIKYDARL